MSRAVGSVVVVRVPAYHTTMKRGLTALLTFALVGSLMFMGFAGTAAAQDGLVDIGSDVDVDQNATSGVEVTTNQANDNEQIQVATSYSSSDTSEAKTLAEQGQSVEQGNANTISDVSSISTNTADTDANTGLDVALDLNLDLTDGDDNGNVTDGDDNGNVTDGGE